LEDYFFFALVAVFFFAVVLDFVIVFVLVALVLAMRPSWVRG
jgi:hypothetical protein